jgi:DNA-binding SARP family transcriptional activator/predicted ATPase
MPQVRLFLFGPPRIEQSGASLPLGVRKAIALFVYLAVTRQGHSRDALAALFWPESNQQEARASLRRMLYRLNQLLGTDGLVAANDVVLLNPQMDLWLDVAEFRRSVARCLASHKEMVFDESSLQQLKEAIDLYNDDFMAGFSLPDCAEFDEWQFFQREELRQSLAAVLEQFANFHEAQAQYEQAIFYARRWLALDRMHEPVHRHLMRLYASAGQQSAALRQYEECARTLDEELGIEPDEETIVLFESIRTRRLVGDSRRALTSERLPEVSPVPAALPAVALEGVVRSTLPAEPLPLIGRDVELAQLQNMLANPRCRLITVVGLGGMGKTHLAVDVAHKLAKTPADGFPDGIVFVPLAERIDPVNPANVIVFALAESLGLPLSGQAEPAQQVLDFLQTKRMLIVLDNLEHLLHAPQEQLAGGDVADLIARILERTSGVKLLGTSREPLQLHSEWRLDLEGLAHPPVEENGNSKGLTAYSAVQLFTQFAQQVQSTFELTPQNAPHVRRLCRLVAGSPLALKLAAAWVRIFTCDRIVDDVQQNLDLLSTQMRNMPARQRSMRAVFDYTWHLLSPEEQQLLLATSVFRGGFTEAAVVDVAGATPHLLAGLRDRGLLQVLSTQHGIRYTLHDLTRQYAADRLAADPASERRVRERHAACYLNFLDGLGEALSGAGQPQALAAIHNEIDNVHRLWEWMLATGNLDGIEKAMAGVWRYYWSRSPGQKGKQFFTEAILRLEEPGAPREHPKYGVVLRLLYAKRGFFHYFLGDFYEVAQRDFQTGLDLAQHFGLRREEADSYVGLGIITKWRGKTAPALRHLHEALAIYREVGNRSGEADALQELSQFYTHAGDYEQARECAVASLAISREVGRPDWIGWSLDALAWVLFCCGEYADARNHYNECLANFERIDHPLGIALALGGLGMVTWAGEPGKRAEARALVERSLALCRHIHHQFHVSSRLAILAQISNDTEQYAEAQAYAGEGLAIAQHVGSSQFAVNNLCALAESLYYRGDLAGSRRSLHRALTLAHEIGEAPGLAMTLYHYATALVIESELGSCKGETLIERQVQALALLEQVAHHPACWAIYREKANRLLDELLAKWPAERSAAGQQRTQMYTLDAEVAEMLHEANLH